MEAVKRIQVSDMLADLDDKGLDMAISYIRFLSAEGRKKRLAEQEVMSEKERINGIVDSLVGILPDDGTTLEDIREERLQKYETFD